MTDRLAELGALQYAVENLSTAGTNPNRLGLAGYIHAAYTEYQAWAAANPGVNPNRLSAKGRLYGYFHDYGYSPLNLFSSGEVGAWYDPSDLTTMFQDRAGTTPVTADGQTVGKILDKSGRGNHATAPSDAARPLYKTDGTYHWLQFDGIDDSLSTSAIDFSTGNKLSIFAGFNNKDISDLASLFGNGDWNTSGKFELFVPFNSAGKLEFGWHGNNGYSWREVAVSSINTPYVTTCQIDGSASPLVSETPVFRYNTVQIETTGTSGTDNTSNFSNASLFLGARSGSSLFFTGNVHSIIAINRIASTQEITDTETWINSKTGAY